MSKLIDMVTRKSTTVEVGQAGKTLEDLNIYARAGNTCGHRCGHCSAYKNGSCATGRAVSGLVKPNRPVRVGRPGR